MKKILVDINIILDFLNKRNFYELARQIMQLCSDGKIKGCVCAHEITTLSYFLEKDKESEIVNKILTSIMNTFAIIPIDENILRNALKSQIKDFEDAVIEVSSLQNKIDCIVSRNINDFANSRIKAISPTEFLEIYGEAKNAQ
ncbi:MAG: PIN domain-containing protein [Fibromonadales bacterium]|nr:PIN domain-containing protein [Fibromonadales bacterium]